MHTERFRQGDDGDGSQRRPKENPRRFVPCEHTQTPENGAPVNGHHPLSNLMERMGKSAETIPNGPNQPEPSFLQFIPPKNVLSSDSTAYLRYSQDWVVSRARTPAEKAHRLELPIGPNSMKTVYDHLNEREIPNTAYTSDGILKDLPVGMLGAIYKEHERFLQENSKNKNKIKSHELHNFIQLSVLINKIETEPEKILREVNAKMKSSKDQIEQYSQNIDQIKESSKQQSIQAQMEQTIQQSSSLKESLNDLQNTIYQHRQTIEKVYILLEWSQDAKFTIKNNEKLLQKLYEFCKLDNQSQQLVREFNNATEKLGSFPHTDATRNGGGSAQTDSIEAIALDDSSTNNSAQRKQQEGQKRLVPESRRRTDGYPQVSRLLDISDKVRRSIITVFEERSRLHWRKVLYKHLGRKPTMNELESFLGDLDAKAKEIAEEGKCVCMRVPRHALLSILKNGFKTQFETGTTSGPAKPIRKFGFFRNRPRSRLEWAMHGYDLNKKSGVPHPKYGYITNDPVKKHTKFRHFGSVIILFKDHIKDQTTISADDTMNATLSLWGGFNHPNPLLESDSLLPVLPVSYRRPNRHMFPIHRRTTRQGILNSHVDTIYPYVEAQIHQKLGANDIEAVIFTDKQPDADLSKALSDHNIPHYMLDTFPGLNTDG